MTDYQKSMKQISKRLKTIRTWLGMTQVELSKKASIYQSELARLENGKKVITPLRLKRLSKALNVGEEMFFDNEEIFLQSLVRLRSKK